MSKWFVLNVNLMRRISRECNIPNRSIPAILTFRLGRLFGTRGFPGALAEACAGSRQFREPIHFLVSGLREGLFICRRLRLLSGAIRALDN